MLCVLKINLNFVIGAEDNAGISSALIPECIYIFYVLYGNVYISCLELSRV
jgi:hypothetical protein